MEASNHYFSVMANAFYDHAVVGTTANIRSDNRRLQIVRRVSGNRDHYVLRRHDFFENGDSQPSIWEMC